jgi:hypothetical protein
MTMKARTPGSSVVADCTTRTVADGPATRAAPVESGESAVIAPSGRTGSGAADSDVTRNTSLGRTTRNSAVALPPATSCSRSSTRFIAGERWSSSLAPSIPSSSASAAAKRASMRSAVSPCSPVRALSSSDSSSCENSATAV